MYRDHGHDRDSSREVLIIGPGDSATYRVAQLPSAHRFTLFRPGMQEG